MLLLKIQLGLQSHNNLLVKIQPAIYLTNLWSSNTKLTIGLVPQQTKREKKTKMKEGRTKVKHRIFLFFRCHMAHHSSLNFLELSGPTWIKFNCSSQNMDAIKDWNRSTSRIYIQLKGRIFWLGWEELKKPFITNIPLKHLTEDLIHW